jgi:hypothetical protein
MNAQDRNSAIMAKATEKLDRTPNQKPIDTADIATIAQP